jgi:hypothetical protein
MNLRAAAVFGIASSLTFFSLARAAPASDVQMEIGYLLQHVEESGCEFYRNGIWYEGKRARAHLRDKYDYLLARNQIDSAEDFIEKAATKSSLSGRPYEIRCKDGIVVSSNVWFRNVLAVFRLSNRTPVR